MEPTQRSGSGARASRTTQLAALLGTSALALTGLVAIATPANAALVTGPDGDTHPTHFTDDVSGVALELCQDGTARCLALPGDLVAPDGEAFYFAAFADAGPFTGEIALEAAFADTTGIVFQRFQYQADGLNAGDTYTITDPFGTRECEATAGRTRCRVDSATPLAGPISQWLIADNAPVGYIGDNATPSTVTGSPTGFNKLRVQGPGITTTCNDPVQGVIPQCEETDQWIVQGKMAPGAASTVNATSLDFGSVLASAPAAQRTKTVTYRSIGTQPIAVTDVTTGGAYTLANNTCDGASLAGGQTCTFDVTFNPVAGVTSAGSVVITDEVGARTIALTGKGAKGVLGSAATQRIADTAVGSTRTVNVRVSNAGDATVALGARALSGRNVGDYRLVRAASNPCTTSIAVGATCNIGVAFAPKGLGSRVATLAMSGDGVARNVSLSARGVDRTRPALLTRTPSAGALRVARNTNAVVKFSEATRAVNRTTFRLTNQNNGRTVRATVSKRSGNRWVLNPRANLAPRTRYTVRLAGGTTAIRDLSNNTLRSSTWRFRTR